VAGVVQFPENLDDDGFVSFVEIAGRLVGKNDLRLIDQRARDGHALLLAAGKLRGEMRQSVAHAHALQRFFGLLFVRDAMEILCEHHVFHGSEIRHEVKLLEDEPHFFRAVSNQLVLAKFRKINAVNNDMSRSERIQAAKNVDQRGFPGARGTHKRNPFARVHIEAHSAKRVQSAVLLDQAFDDHLLRHGSRRRCHNGTHASPLKTDAGRMLASRRSGNALRIATITVNATATGYTINLGRAATPKTALPKPIERKYPRRLR